MPLFQSSSSSSRQNSHLRLPASKRISLPSSQRLITITEGQAANPQEPPPIPRRSSRRNSTPNSPRQSRWSGSTEGASKAPPPYDWVPDPEPTDSRGDDSNLSEDEKLERLRGRSGETEKKRRGGWLRVGLIIGLVLLLIIALAVGLGVGLTRKKRSSSGEEQQPGGASDSSPPQKFPLGQYSLITALKYEDYACTELPATWECYPDNIIFSPSTNTSSLASFDWIISNTSSTYATSSTSSTPDGGIPANLTVSTQFNPWAVSFKDKPLTYISSSTNTSSARYTFSFTMPKKVVPSQPITTDGAATECFFNQTTFTGTMYLSAPHNYPANHSTSLASFEQWPYAVEVTQTALGGTDVPNCYYTTDGHLGDRITFNLDPQPSTNECLCDYRNY